MDNLQTEVLELEFNEFSRGMATITEEEFAKILLRYTTLSPDDTEEYLNRLRQRIPDVQVRETGNEHVNNVNTLSGFVVSLHNYNYRGT